MTNFIVSSQQTPSFIFHLPQLLIDYRIAFTAKHSVLYSFTFAYALVAKYPLQFLEVVLLPS